jgi:hypothetical protein
MGAPPPPLSFLPKDATFSFLFFLFQYYIPVNCNSWDPSFLTNLPQCSYTIPSISNFTFYAISIYIQPKSRRLQNVLAAASTLFSFCCCWYVLFS